MKTLYLDIFSGISGDMFIGAMLDLGVKFDALEAELKKLGLDEYELRQARKSKSYIEGVKFDVVLEGDANDHSHSHAAEPDEHSHEHSHAHSHDHDHAHGPGQHDHSHAGSRDHAQICQLIDASSLSDWVKEKAKAVFHRVAVAEGKVHGLPVESVHFHEVGAVDSIVDIVGGCICLELLGKPRVLAAPVTEGTGFVMCAHGRFPVPTMATLEILGARGVRVNQCDEPHELVTPTGAAILAEFVEEFGLMAGVVAQKVGYGLGTRDNHTRPNVLRAVLGESAGGAATNHDWETDRVVVLETNLDDVSAEVLGHFVETALAAHALDVYHTPIHMKKNRPGVLLSVICSEEDADLFAEMILCETSAFGVRRAVMERRKLQRETIEVDTVFGKVQVKIGRLNGRLIHAAPEYDSCARVARESRKPIREIMEAASRVARAAV